MPTKMRGVLEGLRDDSRRQTKRRIVRYSQRLVVVAHRYHASNRAEHFVTIKLHGVMAVIEQSRRHAKCALGPREMFAAEHQSRAFAFAYIDVAKILFKLAAVDNRAHLHAVVQRASYLHTAQFRGQPLDELPVHRMCHHQPRRGGALLSRTGIGALERTLDCDVDVRIVEHDKRILAAHSICSLMRFGAATAAIRRPVSSEPVNEMPLTERDPASSLPTDAPAPINRLNVPAGNAWRLMISVSAHALAGVRLAGLNRTALPNARAGAIFQLAVAIGKFQGVITPTRPSACGWISISIGRRSVSALPPNWRRTSAAK